MIAKLGLSPRCFDDTEVDWLWFIDSNLRKVIAEKTIGEPDWSTFTVAAEPEMDRFGYIFTATCDTMGVPGPEDPVTTCSITWVVPQPFGQRAVDLAQWVVENYPELLP